jgi:hypothetical protein
MHREHTPQLALRVSTDWNEDLASKEAWQAAKQLKDQSTCTGLHTGKVAQPNVLTGGKNKNILQLLHGNFKLPNFDIVF